MFRIYVYLKTDSDDAADSDRFTGDVRYDCWDDASRDLDAAIERYGNICGGGIEFRVPGIGWIAADTDVHNTTN